MSRRREKSPLNRAISGLVAAVVGLGGGGYFAYLQTKSGETDKTLWAFVGLLILVGLYGLSRFILALGTPTQAKQRAQSLVTGVMAIILGAGSIWAFGNPLESKLGILALGIPAGLLIIVLALLKGKSEAAELEELEEAEESEAVEEVAAVEETVTAEEAEVVEEVETAAETAETAAETEAE